MGSTVGSRNESRLPTDDHGTKSSKPDLFHGERSKLDAWLRQLDLYFRFAVPNTAATDKVAIACTFMRGRAESWIAPRLEKWLDGDMFEEETNKEGQTRKIKTTECKEFEDYANFKKQMRTVFRTANKEMIAIGII